MGTVSPTGTEPVGQHGSSLGSAVAPAACSEGSSHPCQPQQHRAEAEDWREPQDFDSAVLSDTPPPVPAAPQARMWLRPRAHPAGTFLRFPRQWQEPGLLPGSHAQLFSSQPVLQSPLPLQWNSAEHLCLGQHIQGDTSTCRVAQALVQEETLPGWS